MIKSVILLLDGNCYIDMGDIFEIILLKYHYLFSYKFCVQAYNIVGPTESFTIPQSNIVSMAMKWNNIV